MALAAALHHSSDGVRGTYSGLRAQTTARARPEPAELFELYSEDGRPGGLRPPPLSEVRPQDGVMRHAERDLEHALPQLQVLDVPVPPVERTQQFYFLMLHDAGKRAAVLWAAGGGHGRGLGPHLLVGSNRASLQLSSASQRVCGRAHFWCAGAGDRPVPT